MFGFQDVLLIITQSNTSKMDSAEIVYATVDEIIGKTGEWSRPNVLRFC